MAINASRPGQFPLRELFGILTVACLWSSACYYAGPIWFLLSLFLIGPLVYFLSRRWRIYPLEAVAVLITLTSPLWVAAIAYCGLVKL